MKKIMTYISFENKRNFFEIVCIPTFFFCLSLFTIRKILFKNETIGLFIDWMIPPDAYQLKIMAKDSLYIWNRHVLGFDMFLNVGAIREFLQGFFGFFGYTGVVVSKIFVITVTTLSGTTMYFLIKELYIRGVFFEGIRTKIQQQPVTGFIGNHKLLNTKLYMLTGFISSLYYSISPQIFHKTADGARDWALAYAISPFVFLCYLKSVKNNTLRWPYIILTSLSFCIANIQNQFSVMLSFMFFVYWLLCDDKRNRIKALGFILLLIGALSAYWILNTILTFNDNFKSIAFIASESSGIPLENIFNYALPIFRIFNFHYSLNPFTENTFSSVSSFYKIWYYMRFTFVIFLFFPAIFLKKNKLVIWSLIIIVLGMFIVKGGRQPLSAVNYFLYNNFTPMFLFKSMDHCLFMIAFSYTILLAISFHCLYLWLRETRYQNFFLASIVILILFNNCLMFTGNYGGWLNTFKPSVTQRLVDDFLENDVTKDCRVQYIPAGVSSVHVKRTKHRFTESEPEFWYSPTSVVFSDHGRGGASHDFAQMMEKKLYLGIDVEPFYKLANVKYVILRSYVDPANCWYKDSFYDFAKSFVLHPSSFDILRKQRGLTLIKKYPEASVFYNNNFLPRILVNEAR